MIFNRDLTFLHQLWLYRGFYTSNKYAIMDPLIYSMKTATLFVPLEMFLIHTGYNVTSFPSGMNYLTQRHAYYTRMRMHRIIAEQL